MHSIKAIKWLRHTGIIEGISSLLLFFVAMPLKYLADKPQACTRHRDDPWAPVRPLRHRPGAGRSCLETPLELVCQNPYRGNHPLRTIHRRTKLETGAGSTEQSAGCMT